MCRRTELRKRSLQGKRVDWVLSLHPLHTTASTRKVRPVHEAVVRDSLCDSAADAPSVGKLPTRSAADDQEACRGRGAYKIVATNSSLCIYAHVKVAEVSFKFANVSLTFDARMQAPVLVVADSFCRGSGVAQMREDEEEDEVAHSEVWAFTVHGDIETAREVLSWLVAEGAFSNDLYDHYNFNLSGLAAASKERCVIRKNLFGSCVLVADDFDVEDNNFVAATPCLTCSVHFDHPHTMCDHSCRGGRALTLVSGESSSVEELIRHEVSLMLDMGEHPNIARFYGAFDVSSSDYFSAIGGDVCWALLIESCQYNLLDDVRKSPYPEHDCVQLAKSLLGALQHVHSAGIVHRKVQPASVQVWPCGRFVLTDFHQAVRVSEGKELASPCCKKRYSAPEVCEGREADCDSKMDIFAFGLVLYFATSGVEPLSIEVSPQELAIKPIESLNDVVRQTASKNSDMAPDSRSPSETTTPRNDAHKYKLGFSCSRTKILSRQFQDFLLLTTQMNPSRRPTAEDALDCEWLGGASSSSVGEADASDVGGTFALSTGDVDAIDSGATFFSFSSGEADALDGDFGEVPSPGRQVQRSGSVKLPNRPQTPLSPSGSARKAILELRKSMDGEPTLSRTIACDDPPMPVAPCGRPTSRFKGRRAGAIPSP